MGSRARSDRHTFPFVAALGIVVAAFVFLVRTVIALPPDATVGRAAAPWPDGAEYLDAAVSFTRGDGFRIHVGGELHPSRYPIGYPALIAAALVAGVPPEWAAHRVNHLAAVLLLGVVAAFAWRRGGPWAGALAAVFLVSMPAFVVLARSPLSEIVSAVVTTAGIALLWEPRGGRPGLLAALGAWLLGASLFFRVLNVLIAFPLVAGAFLAARLTRQQASGECRGRETAAKLGARAGRRESIRDAILLGGAVMLGALPALACSRAIHGSWLAGGYGYWIPRWNWERAFETTYVPANLVNLGRDLLEIETSFTTANLYGDGSYVAPALVALALFGAREIRWRWMPACFAAALAVHFRRDARLLLSRRSSLLLAAHLRAALGCRRAGSRRLEESMGRPGGWCAPGDRRRGEPA